MKKALLFAVPFVLAFVVSTAVRAEEGGEKKAAPAKAGEWTLTIGCAHCNFGADTKAETCAAAGKTADGKVINLTGNVAKEYKKGGDYVVKGKLSDDGKTIEVAEMKKKE
jgi:uncharacterized protein YdeI (BOF family)